MSRAATLPLLVVLVSTACFAQSTLSGPAGTAPSTTAVPQAAAPPSPVTAPSGVATSGQKSMVGDTTTAAGPVTMIGESIGIARMTPDGTITLELRAEGPGAVGDAQLVYRTDDRHYADIMRHLGGLNPGEVKPVPPWRDGEAH